MKQLFWLRIRSWILVGGASIALLCPATVSAQSGSGLFWFSHPDGTTHWYEAVAVKGGITWNDAHRAAAAAGGYLATITSSEENEVVGDAIQDQSFWEKLASDRYNGPWLGGLQRPGSKEPTEGWVWAEGEAWSFAAWDEGMPDNDSGADRVHFGGGEIGTTWADSPATAKMLGYLIEYSGQTVPVENGLERDDVGSFAGYTLFGTFQASGTYLIDMRGRIVNSWSSDYQPGMSIYLLPGGDLIRCGNARNSVFPAGGAGGVVERFSWSGERLWFFQHSSDKYCLHHDIEVMPNGNILMISWELKTKEEAIAAGRDPEDLRNGVLWPLKIIEVDPAQGSKIVWEWHSWDHLIQDFDETKANYGKVEDHPERIDINWSNGGINDWHHTNAIDYNANLDQVMVSIRGFDEIWILDHTTNTKQASRHTGGRYGMGGDLLYRWGNPAAYRAGTAADRRLFKQHDAHWIPDGLSGAGNIMIFNNGPGRPGGDASSVDEIVPPVDRQGRYPRTGAAWGPKDPVWSYSAPNPTDFFSGFVSGAQRLQNGNTLICSGWNGHFFEITPAKKMVWEYRNPSTTSGILTQGTVPGAVTNVSFRSPRYFAGGPELQGRDLTPGEPLELHPTVLLVEGSTLRHRAKVGETIDFTLRASAYPGRLYQMATSAAPGLLPVDYRFVRLAVDPVLFASIANSVPSVFQGYVGRLDSKGQGHARIVLPPDPRLVGLKLCTAFVVADPAAPSGLAVISNTVVARIQ